MKYNPEYTYEFSKGRSSDKVWQVVEMYEGERVIGRLLYSFDRKKLYNLWGDYPYCMTDEEIAIFDKEHPFWADFFKWRKDPAKFEEQDKDAPWYKAWEKRQED